MEFTANQIQKYLVKGLSFGLLKWFGGRRFPLKSKWRGAGMSKERVYEAVKKLIEKGFKYQIIEEERKVGFISKKKTYIVKL